MIKNFIVPIDFSEDALKGLDLALLFAQKTYTNIQMVYVQKRTAEHFPTRIREEYNFAKDKFEKILQTHSDRLGNNSKLRYIIKKGPKVYEEVVNQAESYKDSIIAASTHGASGFEEFFIGSNAFKIISATIRPVITIRKGPVPLEINKIVLPIDTMVETRQKVPLTADIAELFGAEVHVIEVSSTKSSKILKRLNAYSKQVCGYMKGRGLTVKTDNIIGNNIADVTVDYAHAINADMISIITEQGTSITNLILGNHAQQVLNKSIIPVLNITPKEMHFKGSFSAVG
jgi:nucleotide-binding universal stress UspA family protein